MSAQISKDFELLSAYIDNQLSPAEKAALEARLDQDVALRATLNDLRRTVRTLHSLPMVKPPRNFTLTAQQVGARPRRGPLFPAFRLAAALCTLLLAVAVARDFVTTGLSASSAAPLLTTENSLVTPLAQPNAAAIVATPTPESLVDNYGISASVAAGGDGTAQAVTPFSHLAPSGGDETATPAEPSVATADATRKNLPPSETPAEVSGGAGGVPSATETVPQDVTAQTAAAPPTSLALRVVEIVLAGLALVAAAGAWFTRRA
jgi:hypothetical protein